jgi:protein-S-isoprenylcysteine O-methyltransferase Ste14
METLRLLPLIFWVILWTYWLISAFRVKKSVPTDRTWWFRTIGIRLVIFIVVVWAIYAGHGGAFEHIVSDFFNQSSRPTIGGILLGVLGVFLCATGITFAIWARVYLGKNWGMPMTFRKKPELVASGPYRFVRHPIYSGFLLAVLGTALVDGPIWFLVLLFMGIYFIYSAKVEEGMMLKEFPDQYPAYMKRTKAVIPFVW